MKLLKNTSLAFIWLLCLVRPGYSIPQFISDLCQRFKITACTNPSKSKKEAGNEGAERKFSTNEAQVLTQLLEKQKQLKAKEDALTQREIQLKKLYEDLQTQMTQLENLQKEVNQDIESKKAQDLEQLDKVTKLYEKMDPAKAGKTIAQLESRLAVQILMRLKDKQASEILSYIDASTAAKLVEAMTRKKP